ncbi:MAG TPA: hypothetical protein VN815_07145 [Steroidobacteraceae bacterium]|nr:hypothetical protein [Steroidobacteraceae bacterium]
MQSPRDPIPQGPSASAFVLLGAGYLAVVAGIWLSPASHGGWAEGDARAYHFPIINYFMENGFDLHYPPDLIAMFPGMHLFFAYVARGIGLAQLPVNSPAALLIQSVFGVLLLLALYRLALATTRSRIAVVVLALPVISSRYVLYSWVWPTTDLGSLAFYAWMLAFLTDSPLPTPKTSIGHSVLTAASIFFRQSYAVLSLASIANSLALAVSGRHEKLSSRAIALTLPPIIVALACVAYLIAIWGSVIPPGFQRHLAGGFNIVSLVHIAALSGLIGWPFAPALRRLLSGRDLKTIAMIAIAIAVLCTLTVPLDFNIEAGRYNSLVWTLARSIHIHSVAAAIIGLLIALGAFLWISMIRVVCRGEDFPPELTMFALFSAGLLVQKMAWQRYVEPEMLLTFGVFFARRELDKFEAGLILAAYGIYGAISLLQIFIG